MDALNCSGFFSLKKKDWNGIQEEPILGQKLTGPRWHRQDSLGPFSLFLSCGRWVGRGWDEEVHTQSWGNSRARTTGLHIAISLQNSERNLQIPTWSVHRTRAPFYAIFKNMFLNIKRTYWWSAIVDYGFNSFAAKIRGWDNWGVIILEIICT